jgi:phosphoglucosamine mutase
VIDVYPQELINVGVADTATAKSVAASQRIERAVLAAEKRLGDEGRILLRPSGTEPVVRVMVEHEDKAICRDVCEEVARVVAEAGIRA